MAVELTANAVQNVVAGQNVLFTDTPVKCNRGYVVHRDGSGLVTLRSPCNGCASIARYKVLFNETFGRTARSFVPGTGRNR